MANQSAADRISRVVAAALAGRGFSGPPKPSTDLRRAGLTSLDFVNLMLAVEAEFGVEFRQSDMTLANFQSIKAIEALIATFLAA